MTAISNFSILGSLQFKKLNNYLLLNKKINFQVQCNYKQLNHHLIILISNNQKVNPWSKKFNKIYKINNKINKKIK